jgi:hypothetical protein
MGDGIAAKYWAFISYSHQDKRLARQLADRLAKEPVPKAARDRVEGAEKTFSALFLDEREAAAGSHLGDRLERALDAPHALIVICSPFSAASSYVAQEIAYFHKIGRADRIFCLIGSGQPNASDTGAPHLECFPPPLRFQIEADGALSDRPRAPEDRPLAAAVGLETPKEWRKALDQLAAGMLGITQSDLERARSRRQLIKGALIAGASVAALAVVGVLYDGLVRPQTQYFENWARRDGIWLGIDQLSAGEARQRNSIYAFRYNGSWSERPRAVERVNGHGACHIDGMEGVLGRPFTESCSARRSCGVQFTYADVESEEKTKSVTIVAREDLVDQSGVVVESLQFTGPVVGTFVEAQFPCTHEAAGISYVQFERFGSGELRGFDREVQFLGEDRNPRPNNNRVYGFRFERDSSGRVLSRTNLGPRGDMWIGADQVARVDYVRDERGRPIEENYAGADGAPTLTGAKGDYVGVAGLRRSFDPAGNVTRISYVDAGGRPTLTNHGVGAMEHRYGPRGEELAEIYFDLGGSRTYAASGLGELRSGYDNRGYLIERTYADENGQPVGRYDGIARVTMVRDRSGAMLEERLWDLDGRPYMGRVWYHVSVFTYNERGQRLTERYFGLNDEPVVTEARVHGRDRAYDENFRLASITSIGLDGRPVVSGADGEEGAIRRYTLDDRGNVTEVRYFDAAEAPMLTQFGRHLLRQEFDDLGRHVRSTNHGLDDTAVMNRDRIASWTYSYDERGNRTESRALGLNGVEIAVPRRLTYDARDREIERVNIGSDGQPSGMVTRRSYDERGREAAISYFTTTGAPMTQNGHHREQREYDFRGRLVGTSYFGVSGEPVLNDGVHERRYVTNRYGSRIEDRAFGVNGEPVPMSAGRTHHLVRYRHDERSLQTENTFFDIADRPTTDRYGVSIYRLENDPRGLRVREAYFGVDGKPVAYDGRYWGIEFDYDAAGLRAAQRAYNAEGQVFDAPGAGPQQAYVSDRFGRRLEQRNLGIDGELDPTAPRAFFRTEYDTTGRVVRVRNFGADGEPMNHRTQGWAVEETTYDPNTGAATTVRYNTAGRRIS